ncbi:MAG TPA: hypothetical protein VME20_09845 [Acidimicrobiales bacterium]|nr:hypothetical protein [Acidimicrobiales bacterium]
MPASEFELACGSSQEEVTLWNPKGTVAQPVARDVFPPALNPGTYSRVVIGKVSSPCFQVYASGAIFVLGAAPWDVSIKGYPAKTRQQP